MRPWRLALTQGIKFNKRIEWIGWWIKTPKEVCLKWNQQRDRTIEEEVIHQYSAALSHKDFSPDRSEGFTSFIYFDPSIGKETKSRLEEEINRLPKRIAAARNKEKSKELHGYSRLIDLERLLFLIQLLIFYPGLSATDLKTNNELKQICNPLPEGSMSDRASIFLKAKYGECYSDKDKLEKDLKWLESQGFKKGSSTQESINPPLQTETTNENMGGWPPLADKEVFIRVMTFLRYILQNPFDGKKEKGTSLFNHYINKLDNIYMAGEANTLREDINKLLTPYGFRRSNDNVRHGYGLGTAVLSTQRLKDLSHILNESVNKLGDPTASIIQEELNERLQWASIETNEPSTRVFGNRSIINTGLCRADSLANPEKAEKLEHAISHNQRIYIERFKSSGGSGERIKTPKYVWPLQLIFHNIGWYIAYEEDRVGNGKRLISTERLDRLALRQVDTNTKRDPEEKNKSIRRLEKLMEISGGIYFGEDENLQYLLTSLESNELKKNLLTVRFRSTPDLYKYLREGLQRYPVNQLRLSKPIKNDMWKPGEEGPFSLEPLEGTTHPFPMEIDLPRWTIENDYDFMKWLLGFGEGIIIEEPKSLVKKYAERIRDINKLYS